MNVSGKKSPTAVPSRPRRGRPPAEETGLVNARILDVATSLFLEQGFGRTTLNQVSQASRTGKSTLYSRYADKEALFAAVVQRSIDVMFVEMAASPAVGSTIDRLRHVGLQLANSLLVPRCVALMRITAAEAINFPSLATMAYRVSFEGSVRCVLAAITTDPSIAPPAPEIAMARRFVELALHPISFQAAYGADIEMLRERCGSDVEDAILLLRIKKLLAD